MMYKLRTQFKNFCFRTFVVKDPVAVEWFYFDPEDGDNEIRGFEPEEFKKFQQYTTSNTINFPENNKDRFITDENDVPYLDYLDSVPHDKLTLPKFIILMSNSVEDQGYSNVMHAKLLDEFDNKQSRYNLDFAVMGKIISWKV